MTGEWSVDLQILCRNFYEIKEERSSVKSVGPTELNSLNCGVLIPPLILENNRVENVQI